MEPELRWYQGRSAADWAYGALLLVKLVICGVLAPVYLVWVIWYLSKH